MTECAKELEELTEEERLVAELRLLGIRYLSRQTAFQATSIRPPEELLADLVQQPNARVRAAAIAVLLCHPEYAEAVPAALERLAPEDQNSLRAFYAAAVLLQQEYADRLRAFQQTRWRQLPEVPQIMADLNVPTKGAPRERLAALGREQRRRAARQVNWTGTYGQVARQLLRQWERERQWNR